MVKMEQVHVIRHKVHIEGESIRGVARELGLSRVTVRKYMSVSEPQRVERVTRAKPVLENVVWRIEQLLEEWGRRTTTKQRLTGTRLHRQLREEGFRVGVTTVREYLREKRRQAAEVYIPLIYQPGEVAQVDFFEVVVEEAGVMRKVWKFLMHLMYSGYDFVWLYERCDQTSFLDGHVRAFAYLGGVPERLTYDNLTAAVRRCMGGERQLTERFQALASHYLFEPCFARPGEGHDKGGVESRGKNVRLQHLVPIPRGDTLSEISEALLAEVQRGYATKQDVEGRSVSQRFEEERNRLRALPSVPFEARRVLLVCVSSKATVQIEGAIYSVPSHWARLEATAWVGVEQVRLICLGQDVSYPKQKPGRRLVKYRHYLPELARKPQAVRQVATQLIHELGPPYGTLWELLVQTYGPREAARVLARILGAIVQHGEAAVRDALQQAIDGGRCDLLALSPLLHPSATTGPIRVPDSLSHYEIESSRASDYDWLLSGGVQ
jgi:transposase